MTAQNTAWVSCLAAFVLVPVCCLGQGYVTNTVTRGGVLDQRIPESNSGLDISGPGVLAADPYGNLYVTVRDGIFKVDVSGNRTRVAGVEREWRYSGDEGPAIQAQMNPRGIAADTAGNVYFADSGNNRIRKIDTATGIVTTVAGNGRKGFSGDGGPATEAQLDGPTGVAVDLAGNLYIADGTVVGTNRIRRIAAATGIITTIAGNGSQGYSGDGGPATKAQISSLGGLAVDVFGNVYIADNYNNRIRMVSETTGIITTVAGNGETGSSGDGDFATGAQLNNPLDVAVDTVGNLYIADSGNYRVRKVSMATGLIATLAEDTSVLYGDGQHGYPCALTLDARGNVFIADSGISRIRKLSARTLTGLVATIKPAASSVTGDLAATNGLKINVTYDNSMPAEAQIRVEPNSLGFAGAPRGRAEREG